MRNVVKSILIVLLVVLSAPFFCICGQTTRKPAHISNRYAMRPDSPNKPEMRQIIVRLKGDKGISIIDLITGKVVARNFAPYANSQGKVIDSKFSTPVIDDMFCIFRSKTKTEHYSTIYQNAAHPQPIPGLTNLYSAQIVNPNLFPICKYGERIKFVDRKGNVKFTVMPIDGNEPRKVNPFSTSGLFIVEVGNFRGSKYGAIDATGKWVVYPDYDKLDPFIDGLIGTKGDKSYIIDSTGKAVEDKTPAGLTRTSTSFLQNAYFKEKLKDENGNYSYNIYDSNYNYRTTIDANYIALNHTYSNIATVSYENRQQTDSSKECLLDLSRDCAAVSKKYEYLFELPDGNYRGINNNNKDGIKKTKTYYYVKTDGTETVLYTGNQSVEFPIRTGHSLMALFYTPQINRFIVYAEDGTPGYIIDFNGKKVGDLMIEEFLSMRAKWDSVYSHYYYEKYGK